MPSVADLLNFQAPDFALPLVGGGGRLVLSDLRNKFTVIHFWSADCPWSRRADLVLVYRRLAWERLNVQVVGIACNPLETESGIKAEMETRHIAYPVVVDFSQDIANSYRVQVTPTFVVLDRRNVVRYTGAMDDTGATRRLPKTFYLDKAVQAVVHDESPNPAATPVLGTPLARRGQTEIRPAPGLLG